MESQIAAMENQIASMKNNLAALKRTGGKEKHKEKKEKRDKPAPPIASTSKAAHKPAKAPAAPKGKKSKKPVTDDDVLTFEQKKDLSDTISKLDGAKLEKVIQIIHEGVPEIRDVRITMSNVVCRILTSCSRALRRSSSKSINYQPPYSRSSTTSSSGR